MATLRENHLQHVEQLLREGNKQEALSLLAVYLQGHPDSVQAWWLLSFAVPDPKQQLDCVERVLRLDPANVLAQARLEKLRGHGHTPKPVPPFVNSVAFDEPMVVSIQPHKQDSKPLVSQKPSASAKPKSRTLQYAVLAAMGFIAVSMIMFVIVIIAQGGIPMRSSVPDSFTQISLPPTWTPTPIPTRISATQMPIQGTAPAATPVLNVVPTSTIPRSQIGPANGYYAPDFSLNNVNTNVTTSLSEYEGRAVIIFFWATWCQVCKGEMPAVQMIYEAYKDQGLTVLAVDVGENASSARRYRDAHLLTFPILDDAGQDVASKYRINAFPTIFFVERSGVISSITVGGAGYWAYDKKVKAMLALP